MRLYASQHPEEVTGLILVDAVNSDLDPESSRGGEVPELFTLLYHTAFLGTPRLVMPGIILEPKANAAAREFRLAMLTRTRNARAIYDKLTGQANWREVHSAMRQLGDKPVIVITTRPKSGEMSKDSVVGGARWRQAQEALVGISRRSRLILAGHTALKQAPARWVAARLATAQRWKMATRWLQPVPLLSFQRGYCQVEQLQPTRRQRRHSYQPRATPWFHGQNDRLER